jgi:predicted nucleotidyltransferase
MKKKSLNISKKIDPEKAKVIITVNSIAESCGIPIFITGAAARDLVIESAFGVKTIRATDDIDFGIMVQGYEQFEVLAGQLINSGQFLKTEKSYRYLFGKHQQIDILPFGPVADKEKNIRLPGDEPLEMNTMGYEEAFQYAIQVQIQEHPQVSIKMADPASLAIMKLISWEEKYPVRDKDAKDFQFIMSRYLEFDNIDYAYESHSDLMSLPDFDFETTGARILGRDIAFIVSPMTCNKIQEILLRETDQSGSNKLLRDMRGVMFSEENTGKNSIFLEQVKIGFLERKKQ